ncbi:kinase-like domain-containing protein [Tuber indicum]|nr:kinase-like domain-containing protein [Tuber indicum]
MIQQRQFLLGEGAWSKVYAIRSHKIAVKTPSTPASRGVIEKEAKILHYLATTLPDLKIAQFRGFDVSSSSLFMELVSMGTLEDFVEQRARELVVEKAEGGNVMANMRRPVVGMGQWLFLAERLAAVFSQLKGVGVVHGDVKWSNILLREFRPTSGNPEDAAWAACKTKLYEPVVVDFSSGHFHLDGGELPEAVNAVTTAFCAPELLESFISRPSTSGSQITPPVTPTSSSRASAVTTAAPHPLPTFQSDLYSVALCLLAAAIGSEVYRNAGKFVGIYVRQGNPVGWVRGDERGLRIGRGCVVLDVLKDCFGKVAEERIDVGVVGRKAAGWREGWLGEGQDNSRWGC